MQSGGRVLRPRASVACLQPRAVEDSDHVIETVGAADRDESLTAAASAGYRGKRLAPVSRRERVQAAREAPSPAGPRKTIHPRR
jgi:hypothetical protein